VAEHRDSQFFLGPIGGLVEGDGTSWKALDKFLGTLQGGKAYWSPPSQAAAEQSLVGLSPAGLLPVGNGVQASGSSSTGSRTQQQQQQQQQQTLKESSGLYVYYKVSAVWRSETSH
jgi:hypothetical protein